MSLTKFTKTMIGDKRRYRRYKARTARLPAGYRAAIDALERYLFIFGPGKGERILAMLDDLADLFEQSAADGTPVREIVGADPVEFVETFVRNYPEGGWIARERERLTEAIDRAAGDGGRDGGTGAMSAPTVARPAITLSGLKKSYRELDVLRGVDLDVAPGTIFALLGSNGAGKTTIVRILSTLLKFDAGTASVNGFDVATEPARVRESISLTGQFAAVDELLSGRENLVLVARLRHLADPGAVADSLLARFALTDAAARKVSTYSGGMRRRLDIAMSLVGRPTGDLPRRADQRARSAGPPGGLGRGRASWPRTARPSC